VTTALKGDSEEVAAVVADKAWDENSRTRDTRGPGRPTL